MQLKPDKRTAELWRELNTEYKHPNRHRHYRKLILVIFTIVMAVLLWY